MAHKVIIVLLLFLAACSSFGNTAPKPVPIETYCLNCPQGMETKSLHDNEYMRIFIDVFNRFELVSAGKDGAITEEEYDAWITTILPELTRTLKGLQDGYRITVEAHVNRLKNSEKFDEQMRKSETMAETVCLKLKERGLNDPALTCRGRGWNKPGKSLPPEDPRQCRITIEITAQHVN